MTVGELPEGQKPRVEDLNGKVAIWAGDEVDPVGVLITPNAAILTGLACLRIAARLQGGPISMPRSTIDLETTDSPNEEVAARIVITVEGAPLAVEIGAHQFVELAAAIAAIAREIG